ncbi:hypothetical protein GCM10011338_12760 [Alteromonas lipolytica]|nr:hypothetical protein GCM10011338_12760 [Alteromonas lipolytica]
MTLIKNSELEAVTGGILPVVAYGVYFGSAALGSFAASVGFAVGAEMALREKK